MCSYKRGIPLRFLVYMALILPFIASGCSGSVPSDKIVVQINDYPLTLSEYNEMLEEAGISGEPVKTREAFVENLINRKLLLQEAQRKGLDKEKDFLRSIEKFWEQSLLKIIIDKKTSEILSGLEVTDKEMEDYYENWARENPDDIKPLEEVKGIIRWQLLRLKQSLILDAWIKTLRDKAHIKIDRQAICLE